MTDRNTSNLATILAEALARPKADRAAFLDRACAGNAAMRRDLDDLLSAHGKVGEFLNRPAAGPEALREAATLDAVPHDDVGSVIDRYKLLQLIGEGGFGSVFMAEQTDPVRRMVALKVIKLGMDTRQVIARFEVERQALAMMDHPNIARVLDAGATAAGRPYFVMELVKGIPITHYCDQNNLSTKQRLELFITVCQAVQHAHQKGVIHRDIKPSNVLVTLHDGVPVPKVIDFGIAKATSARLTEKTLFTEFRQLIGTPEYMSPEQAEMSGLDIDTRSDVYSLGVLLYELLTGTTPFDSRTLRSAGYAEIQRIIREVEPPRPSTRLSTMGAALPGVAAHRGTEARKLGSIVRGDLDWIVMKALEKDRTRRYETANGMASDVQRYLANEPVTAGPPSATYRLRKFVRRNRGAVLAASLLLAALLAGIAGTTVGLLRAMRSERDQAELVRLATEQLDALGEKVRGQPIASISVDGRDEPLAFQVLEVGASPRDQITGLGAFAKVAVDGLIQSRERAEVERDKSKRIAEFMESTLAGAGPIVAVGRDTVMLREMMDSAAKRIADGELRSSPEAELRLRLTIGDVYRQLSAYEKAEGMLRPAVDLARQVHAGDHETTAQALNQLAITLDSQGKLEDALETSQAAMDMARRLHPEDHEMVASAMIAHGEVLHELNHTAESEALMRDGIAMYQRLGEGECMFAGEAYKTLAAIAREREDLEAAEPLYLKAFEIHRRNIVGDHPALAAILHSLGMLHFDKKDFAQAEQNFRASMDMHERLFKGDHINIARNIDALAAIARARGEPDEAVRLLERSMAMRERLVGADSIDMASSMKNLAVIKYEIKDYDGAETLARDALAIYRRQLPIDHSDTQGALLTLAIVLQDKGDVAGSIDLRRELLESQRRSNPGDSVVVARTLMQLGMSLLQVGKPAEAETMLRECLAMRAAVAKDPNARPPQLSWHVANTKSGLGEALIAQAEDESQSMESRMAKLREAEPLVTEGYTSMEADPATPRGNDPRIEGGGDNRVREAIDRVIRLYETWEKIEPGRGHADKAKEWREKASD